MDRTRLTDDELLLFNAAYPELNPAQLPMGQVWDMLAAAYPGTAGSPALIEGFVNDALGIQDVGGPSPGTCGPCETGGAGTLGEFSQSQYTELHAKTYIPGPFRMRHARAGSGLHLALLGSRIVLTFANKRSCAAFCNAWNAMFSHIGSANEFIPDDVIKVFSDMLIGGSGKYGTENQFSPPFKGRIL